MTAARRQRESRKLHHPLQGRASIGPWRRRRPPASAGAARVTRRRSDSHQFHHHLLAGRPWRRIRPASAGPAGRRRWATTAAAASSAYFCPATSASPRLFKCIFSGPVAQNWKIWTCTLPYIEFVQLDKMKGSLNLLIPACLHRVLRLLLTMLHYLTVRNPSVANGWSPPSLLGHLHNLLRDDVCLSDVDFSFIPG